MGGGGGWVRSNVAIGWFFPCYATDKCKILRFLLRKISDSTLTQAVTSQLNSNSNNDQHDSTLTRLMSLIFKADWTLSRLILVLKFGLITAITYFTDVEICMHVNFRIPLYCTVKLTSQIPFSYKFVSSYIPFDFVCIAFMLACLSSRAILMVNSRFVTWNSFTEVSGSAKSWTTKTWPG